MAWPRAGTPSVIFKRASKSFSIFAAVLIVGWLGIHCVPLPDALFAAPRQEVELFDRTGRTLRSVRPDNGPFQQVVEYSEIPVTLIQATCAAEDRRFWRHAGVDWRANVRAFGQLVAHGHVVSGGSTITQQLIKLAQPRPRTFATKIIEALQALRLEQVWNKQQILAAYLNRLDYGNFNRGCAAAARFYFGKSLANLSPAECALLAGLPQAPSRLNPLTHADRANKRQQWVLTQMRANNWLTEDQFSRAKVEPLRVSSTRRIFEAPHFVDLLLSRLGPSDEPRQLRTTLSLSLNQFAEETLRRHLERLESKHVSNGAVVVIDNKTGDVLALVGSENYFAPDCGQVNGAWAPRSPGSALKPFTYLLALEHGATAASVVADVPTEFATATGLFAPVNYNHHCYGPVRYRQALANSLNIAAVKVLASLGGPEPLQNRLRDCGLSTLDRPPQEYGLGLTIGNAEVRLLELANAYACLARLGEFKPCRLTLDPPLNCQFNSSSGRDDLPVVRGRTAARPYPGESQSAASVGRDDLPVVRRDSGSSARRATDARQRVPTSGSPSRQIADPAAAWLIADILSDNEARSLAFGSESPLRFDFPVACKTGTSSDFRDNWAFGYTPEFTVGIWVGNFDGTPMQHVSGVSGAAPVLHDLFVHLHDRHGTTWYPTPDNIVECPINPITGKRIPKASPASASTQATFRTSNSNLNYPASLPLPGGEGRGEGESFSSTSSPSPRYPTPIREKFLTNSLPPFESAADYADPSVGTILLGAEYRDWLKSGDNWLGNRATTAAATDDLRILFPLPGTTVYLDHDLPAEGRRIHLRATGPESLEWQSDSLQIAAEGTRQIAILSEGRHDLTVRNPVSGAQATTWLTVQSR